MSASRNLGEDGTNGLCKEELLKEEGLILAVTSLE